MNIIKYLQDNNFNGISDHAEISSDFIRKGITVSYETMLDASGNIREKRRYIFTNSRRNRKFLMNKLCSEANGLILESPGWRPLAVSTLTPKTNVDTTITTQLLKEKKYDIFQMEDGTIINLYYYNLTDKWVISTARGIEVNECVFNTLDYNNIVDQCLVEMGLVPKEFYDNLDKSINYTIGFKHPDMHPFQENTKGPIYKIWFVQMAKINIDTMEIITNNSSPWPQIPNHTHVKFNVNSISILFGKLKSAYDNFADENIVNYGFLLVAKNPEDFVDKVDYSVLLLESSLMNLIRHLWYDSGYQKILKDKLYNRINMILLNSFLDDNRMEPFSILFPQYRSRMEDMSAIETSVVNTIFSSLSGIKKSDEINPLDGMISILCSQVTSILTVGTHQNPKQKIRDIIHNTSNIDYYYTLNNNNEIHIQA